MFDANDLSVLQIEGDHHSIRPTCIATERDELHEIKHIPRSLGNPVMEASRRVRDRDVRPEHIMDKVEVILAVPQRKGLFAKRTADARDRGLYRKISGFFPLCLQHLQRAMVVAHAGTGSDLVRALILESPDQEGAIYDDEVGEYDYSKLSRQF